MRFYTLKLNWTLEQTLFLCGVVGTSNKEKCEVLTHQNAGNGFLPFSLVPSPPPPLNHSTISTVQAECFLFHLSAEIQGVIFCESWIVGRAVSLILSL